MDWSKAKNTLILVFFVLNIYLLYNLIVLSPSKSISRDNIYNTRIILEKRGITLKCDIPVYSSDDVMLNFESAELNRKKILKGLFGTESLDFSKKGDGEEVAAGSKKIFVQGDYYFVFNDSAPSQPLNLSNKNKNISFLTDFMSGIGIPSSKYSTDTYVENQDGSVSITMSEKFRDFFIFDNHIKAKLTAQGISYMECKRLKSFTVSKKKIIPAYQVLLKNYSGDEKAVIGSIDIGFMGRKLGTDTTDQFPVWRVTAESLKARYFDGYNGEEIKEDDK